MLNPLLLWFLPLAAIPLALHLITLYRLRTVELSTFRFLMEGYVQQRRRLKLLEWLVMLLRTAFVLLIVLTLSRPVVERFGGLFGGGLTRDVALIVDAGATMALKSGGTTSLQRAREAARAVVGKLSPGDHVTLIRAGHTPEVLFDGFGAKPASILDAIDAIEPDIAPSDLPAALGEALGSAAHGPRVIYILSDATRTTFASMGDHPAARRLDGDTDIVVMNTGHAGAVTNLSLIGDPPRAARPVVGLPTLLTATVTAGANPAPVDTRLTLVLDEQQVAQMSLTLQPGQTLTRAVSVTPQVPGVVTGRFELSGDDFPEDDGYAFALNVEPHIHVLLVTGPPPARPAEDPGLFISTALRSPLLARGGGGSEEETIAQSLNVTPIHQDQLNEQSLGGADIAILADVQMHPERGKLLRSYVENGGGLLIFPGPQVNPDHYARQLFSPQPADPAKPPPLRFGPPVGDVGDESSFQPVTYLDLGHPALGAFDEEDREYFGTTRLYRYLPLVTGDGAGTLMRTASGDAVLGETRIGMGRVMAAGFAATPDLSNLPLKGEFVPLLLRSVLHLRRDARVAAANAVRPHEPARIHLAGPWVGGGVEVIGPDGRPHAIELHRTGDAAVGGFPETKKRGHYTFHVQPPPGSSAQLQPRRLGFTVNLDAERLDFTPADRERVVASLSPAKVAYLSGSPDDPVLVEQLTDKREVWRTLIWAMFAVIGVEFFLSTLKAAAPAAPNGFRGRVRRWVDRSVGLAQPLEKG